MDFESQFAGIVSKQEAIDKLRSLPEDGHFLLHVITNKSDTQESVNYYTGGLTLSQLLWYATKLYKHTIDYITGIDVR